MTSVYVSEICIIKDIKSNTDRTAINLCHKITGYCFPIISGSALTVELIGTTSTIIAAIAGIGASVLMSLIVYEPIGREWNMTNENI